MDVIKGSDLKLLLKKKGISQKDVVDTLGFAQNMVSRYYNDKNEMPASFILKVAKLARLQMSDLAKGDGPSVHIVSEPSVVYERTPKKEPIHTTGIDVLINGMPIGEYIQMVEKRLADMERSLKEMEKKGHKVMEMELV